MHLKSDKYILKIVQGCLLRMYKFHFHDFERFQIYRPMLRVPRVQQKSSVVVDRRVTRVHAADCISDCGLVQTEAPTLSP